MSMYYKLSKSTLAMYYNIVGVDLKDINFDFVPTKASYLDKISPFNNGYDYLPQSSLAVDNEMQIFLERMCTEFGYDEYSLQKKEAYFNAVICILHTITNLNIINEANFDYELYFERINGILIMALQSINSLSVEEVIYFGYLIKCQNTREILTHGANIEKVKSLSILTYLALNPNSDIPDYEMYESNKSTKINVEKLMEIINKNLYSKTDHNMPTAGFVRPGYEKPIQR